MIDWGLAEQIAVFVAGEGANGGAPPRLDGLPTAAAESERLVTAYDDPLAAPLDLVPRSPVVAARTERALNDLRALPRA